MKKIKVLLVLIFTILNFSNVYAAEDIRIYIDGESKNFETGPVIENGSTLVPMRAFFEDMGARVYWDDVSRSVIAYRNTKKIKLTIGSLEAFINNNKVYLSVKPQIIGDKTYVPLRFISEALGADVSWNGESRTITINDKTKENSTSYTLLDTHKYEIRRVFKVINYGDKADVELNVMLGAMNNSPYQKDLSLDIIPAPQSIKSDEYGNKYAVIKVDGMDHNQQIEIIVTKRLENSGIKYDINPENLTDNYDKLEDFGLYTKSQLRIESGNDLILKKAEEITGDETNPYNAAKKIYEYVNSIMTYDTNLQYAWKGALSGLINNRGVCEEYSKLFVALMRARKIPARSVTGYWLTDEYIKSLDSGEWTDVSQIPHEWPEFYLDKIGWVIAEPTVTYMVNGIKTVPWSEFANQEKHGHIIWGYYPDESYGIKWSASGHGTLDLQIEDKNAEMRKIK